MQGSDGFVWLLDLPGKDKDLVQSRSWLTARQDRSDCGAEQ